MSWQARRPTLQEVALVTMATRRRCPGSPTPCGGWRRQTVAILTPSGRIDSSMTKPRGSRQPLFCKHGVRQNRVSAVRVVMIGRVVVRLVLVLCNVSAAELLPTSQRWRMARSRRPYPSSPIARCLMLTCPWLAPNVSASFSPDGGCLGPSWRQCPMAATAATANHCRPRRLTFPDSAAAAVNSLGRQESCNAWKSSPHSAPFGPIRSVFVAPLQTALNQFSSGSMRKGTLGT